MLKEMRKKSQHKTTVKRKSTGHYLKIYFLSVTTAVLVFIIGSIFIKPQAPCANSETCKSDLTERIDNNATGTFHGRTVNPPKIDLAYDNSVAAVLGTNTPEGEKHIYIDLDAQKLYAYQGIDQVMDTPIASGKWNATPVGNFNIWQKLRATRMAGGSGADYYNLPNVPYVMYFYNDYGLHGAYWHNNFGHKMSHGCVNMRIVDARDLFAWADGPTGNKQGTPVSVCNSFSPPNNCVQN